VTLVASLRMTTLDTPSNIHKKFSLFAFATNLIAFCNQPRFFAFVTLASKAASPTQPPVRDLLFRPALPV
jgi:hypothetical protein